MAGAAVSPEYKEELARLAQCGRLRQLRPLAGRRGCHVQCHGRELLNLTSNDYLGLAGDSSLLRRFYEGMDTGNMLEGYGLGAASSRLLAGDTDLAHHLEQDLAMAYGRPAALLFNSGYHANIGILPALLGKNDLILSDKLNHASIHDGMQLCRAIHKRFAHRDYDQLERLLATHRHRYERVVIVSESVFSMDGDVADLGRLIQLKKEFAALLYLDEAHGVGLYGERGLGKAEEQGVVADIDLLVGTFGKALASIGAFVICSQDIRDYLVNYSRSLIFTTALPPVVLNWTRFVFQEQQAMAEQRRHLASLSLQFRQGLQQHSLPTAGNTNIIPLIIGSDQETVFLAETLQNHGFLIFPVRPPAVPEGTARFRLSLTADMAWQDLQGLPEILAREISRSSVPGCRDTGAGKRSEAETPALPGAAMRPGIGGRR
ncbi:MAG: 8-amino-7-oxononanoate synthase [Proteobacteria bacterium]|nr:8-amino-7-oxononanoate synthase [Desulfocapsa sp.]MBU3945715.1 8-amino-7-oxononanoate synthase [Pseudomonadota bacterium]MCG2745038.1 8-amino-7-oxononanoate synthase [Desulfobacteraceae bacterium]MBU3982862.1 8-amino-7-oxononanoate synthase [Pseudomonadota bacterium]MBU4027433.1 8-amino-7-oxononanoate synthase [Pseudomonadota bacterium]